MKKKKHKYQRGYTLGQKLIYGGIVCALVGFLVLIVCLMIPRETVKETDETTHGIDVAKYQGTIDWEAAASSGVDFAMIRVGYRSKSDGTIVEDSNARYNLQEAQKYGIKLGVYFFSTAISEEEAVEEANWVADLIARYPITYPVAYDCEGFENPDSRQYDLSKEERTDFAIAFLETIEDRGYEGLFYGSKSQLAYGEEWDIYRLVNKYKIWVAQYPENPDPFMGKSSYEGLHHMWQYTKDGTIPGISQSVDRNVAYFGYDGVKAPKDKTVPEKAFPDPEALMAFTEVNEIVTAKEETNLRSIPSQDADSVVLYTLKNGEEATRIAISDSGWSKILFNGETYYAVSNFLTTDLAYASPDEIQDEGVETRFVPMNEKVTAKDVVNLRNIPSVTNEESQVVAQLKYGDVAVRTGINEDVGWSRVEYNGQVLYCVSSYLTTVK